MSFYLDTNAIYSFIFADGHIQIVDPLQRSEIVDVDPRHDAARRGTDG